VLLKASGGIVHGAADVINVSCSKLHGMNGKNSPMLLGILFAAMGVGCAIGPLVADKFTRGWTHLRLFKRLALQPLHSKQSVFWACGYLSYFRPSAYLHLSDRLDL